MILTKMLRMVDVDGVDDIAVDKGLEKSAIGHGCIIVSISNPPDSKYVVPVTLQSSFIALDSPGNEQR